MANDEQANEGGSEAAIPGHEVSYPP